MPNQLLFLLCDYSPLPAPSATAWQWARFFLSTTARLHEERAVMGWGLDAMVEMGEPVYAAPNSIYRAGADLVVI